MPGRFFCVQLDDLHNKHDWSEKSRYELYPLDLTTEIIEKLFFDAYKHRSYFVHAGESPPHRSLNADTRYFEERTIYHSDKRRKETVVLPNFELLSYIAQHAIAKYFKDKLKKKKK